MNRRAFLLGSAAVLTAAAIPAAIPASNLGILGGEALSIAVDLSGPVWYAKNGGPWMLLEEVVPTGKRYFEGKVTQ
jgi:hypothetical protein